MHCHYNHHFNIMRDTFALFSRSSVCVYVCVRMCLCVCGVCKYFVALTFDVSSIRPTYKHTYAQIGGIIVTLLPLLHMGTALIATHLLRSKFFLVSSAYRQTEKQSVREREREGDMGDLT